MLRSRATAGGRGGGQGGPHWAIHLDETDRCEWLSVEGPRGCNNRVTYFQTIWNDLRENTTTPWSRDDFDRLMSAARRRSTVRRPATAAAAERDSIELGGALAELLVGEPPSSALEAMAAALARVLSLRTLREDLRRHQARLPVAELPDSRETITRADIEVLEKAVHSECTRIRPLLLRSARAIPDLPPDYRRCGKYLLLAGDRLLNLLQETGAGLQQESPQLGAASRLSLLMRARWLALNRL